MTLAQGLYEPNAQLLWLCLFLTAVWYAALIGVILIRWPRTPPAGAAVNDLGAESPAVVDLLTNDFQVTREAIPATMLDLAARSVIAIEDVGIGRYICRIERSDVALTPYEERLMQHLRGIARDGIVPAEAMTTGTRQEALKWWGKFKKEVVAEAQQQGLCKDLFSKLMGGIFFAAGVIIFVIYEAAIGFRDSDEVARSTLLDVVTLFGFGMAFALIGVMAARWQQDTDLGKRSASRWLGVRKSLATTATFPELPPSAVVVWERHLGYGAALGLTPRAVEALPFGREPDRRAWTHYGGGWRQVKVRYPRFKPGYGRHPAWTLAFGVLWCFLAANLLRLLTPFGPIDDGDFLSPSAVTVLSVLRVAVTLIAGIGLVWWLAAMVLATADLFTTREIVGEVLRTRKKWSLPRPYVRENRANNANFVAVFDGRGDTVGAWRVNQDTYLRFNQRQIVRVRITPLVGYVREVTVLTDAEAERLEESSQT